MNVKEYKKTLLENIEELSKFGDDEPVISKLDEDGHPVFLIGEDAVIEYKTEYADDLNKYSKMLESMILIIDKNLRDSRNEKEIVFTQNDINNLIKANTLLGISTINKNY